MFAERRLACQRRFKAELAIAARACATCLVVLPIRACLSGRSGGGIVLRVATAFVIDVLIIDIEIAVARRRRSVLAQRECGFGSVTRFVVLAAFAFGAFALRAQTLGFGLAGCDLEKRIFLKLLLTYSPSSRLESCNSLIACCN